MTTLSEIIAQTPIFQSLSPSETQQLANLVNKVAFPAEEILFQEGQFGDRFYVIIEGQVAIIKALGTPEESPLSICKPGDFLGEMSLLNWDGHTPP